MPINYLIKKLLFGLEGDRNIRKVLLDKAEGPFSAVHFFSVWFAICLQETHRNYVLLSLPIVPLQLVFMYKATQVKKSTTL